MTDEILVESKRHVITLSEPQAAALRGVGKQLASSKGYWGQEPTTDDGDEEQDEASVVHCSHLESDSYEVTVINMVGIIALPELQLVVQPKIPIDHFHFLMDHSPAFPRVSDQRAQVAEATKLWDLVAAWYLNSLEGLLRQGLLSDYEEQSDFLPALRGSLRLQETALAYYQGSTTLACDYDEFTPDTALNRVLRAAALAIAHAPFLENDLRARARRSLARLDEVGQLRRTDLRTALDRRTARYETPLTLAKHVLLATGRTFDVGASHALTFLIPTPALVEEAVRCILRDALAPVIKIEKKGRRLTPSTLRLNPDLVLGDRGVGDVKYKLLGNDWKRPDLYQAVTFATGYRVHDTAIVTFSTTPELTPAPVQVGDVRLQALVWDCSTQLSPEDAARSLIDQASNWLATDQPPAQASATTR